MLGAVTAKADVGVVGLAVMGANFALNLADCGWRVAVYNRTASVTRELAASREGDKIAVAAESLEELVDALIRNRIIVLMVQAGDPVDDVINRLVPLLDRGDILVDGGNSHFTDTERRMRRLAEEGIEYLGVGISGGEEGARNGPSIMAGGDFVAWIAVGPILTGAAARAVDGTVCCDLVGPGGAGHFVKMVHNGIEYADMQLIAEAYGLMRRGLAMSPEQIGDTLAEWGEGRLRSYLIEISADILGTVEDGEPLIDMILDAASQKGTGKWAAAASLDLSEPGTLVAEAVYARIVSSDPERRRRAAEVFNSPVAPLDGATVDDIEASLYASKIVSYAQGLRLMGAASAEYGWGLDLGLVASLWKGGCIIRADFLEDIAAAYRLSPGPADLAEAPFFAAAVKAAESSWRRVVAGAAMSGIPAPAHSSALAYFDGARSKRLPAALIQAQRDYFGAHGFERVDRPRGELSHHDWQMRG